MVDRKKFKDKIYMNVAKELAKLSKDENTKNGAVIVSKEGFPVSWGYNGNISGFKDNKIPHNRKQKYLEYYENHKRITIKQNKYPFMCHAEENALDFGDVEKLKGATIYITGMPCSECARKICKKKISKVVVIPNSTKNKDRESTMGKDDELSKFLFSEAKIELFIGNKKTILYSI